MYVYQGKGVLTIDKETNLQLLVIFDCLVCLAIIAKLDWMAS